MSNRKMDETDELIAKAANRIMSAAGDDVRLLVNSLLGAKLALIVETQPDDKDGRERLYQEYQAVQQFSALLENYNAAHMASRATAL